MFIGLHLNPNKKYTVELVPDTFYLIITIHGELMAHKKI